MNSLLEQYRNTAEFLAEALPDTWKILLFDLTDKKLPTVVQYRATKKQVDALRRYLQKTLKSRTALENGRLINRSDTDSGERLSKTSVQFLRDCEGNPIGALVLYIDLTSFLTMRSYLDSLLSLDCTDLDDVQQIQTPAIAGEPTLEMIDSIVREFSDAPDRLTPDEKTELIIDLYDSGVLDLKGAVAKTAEVLKMSEPSVYRYLAKIKRARGE